jgi:hypothetical protein
MTSGGKKWRLIAYTALTLLALCNTLRRIMFEGVKPFDWLMLIVEVLVLIFVGYEVGVTIANQIQRAKRQKKLREIEAILRSFVLSGEMVKRSVPGSPYDYSNEWVQSGKEWMKKVEEYLGQSSDKALIEFRRMTIISHEQRKHITADGQIFYIAGSMGDAFQLLCMRLENLHQIAHKVEDYF